MDKIYVTGHRNPDTDSIVSARAYAALRTANTVPVASATSATRRSSCSTASASTLRSAS